MDVMHVKSAVHEVGEQLAREMALSEKHLQAAKLAVAKFDAIRKKMAKSPADDLDAKACQKLRALQAQNAALRKGCARVQELQAQNAGLRRRLAEVVNLNDWRRSALQNNVPLNDSCFCRAARYLHDLANGKEKPVSHVQLQANQLVRACKFLFTYIFTSLHLAPWHLSPGSWQLAAGTWQLAPGTWQLAAGSWQLAAGTWHLAPGTWRLARGSWHLEPGSWQVPGATASCHVPGVRCCVPGATCQLEPWVE